MGLFASMGSGLARLFGGNRTTPSATQMSGTDGVFAFGGHLTSFERKPELKGSNLYATYDKMMTTTVIVSAAVRYFQNLIGGTSWTVTPKDDSPDSERAADLVRTGLVEAQLETMPWESVVRKAALYRFYGFSSHEWSLRKRASDGAMIFGDIQHRPQYTVELWDIPPEGGRFVGFVQRAYGQARQNYVWRDQMLYCVDNTLNDNPDGVGLLRHITEHARRLDRYEQIEGFGYDGDLCGMPIGRVPGAALKEKAATKGKGDDWVNEQTAAVRALVRNHFKEPNQGIVLDSEQYTNPSDPTSSLAVPKWAIELLKTETGNLANVHVVIERLTREIARVLGMEFLVLGGDGKGSLALSRDKTSMFASMLEATLSELSKFATHDLVFPLLRYNGIDPELYAPKFQAEPIATERVEAAVAALVGLAQAGAVLTPDDGAIDAIRARLHLPPQPERTPQELAALLAPRSVLGNIDLSTGMPLDPNHSAASGEDDADSVNASDPKPKPDATIAGDPGEVDGKPEVDASGNAKPKGKAKPASASTPAAAAKAAAINKQRDEAASRAVTIMALGKLTHGERALLASMQEE